MQFFKSKYLFNSGEGENETFKDFIESLPAYLLVSTPHERHFSWNFPK